MHSESSQHAPCQTPKEPHTASDQHCHTERNGIGRLNNNKCTSLTKYTNNKPPKMPAMARYLTVVPSRKLLYTACTSKPSPYLASYVGESGVLYLC